jgi:hypothetical protein
LCQLAANAGALAIAQVVASPDQWAHRWWGKQWQQNLLGGQGSFSELHSNPNCRWNHAENWGTVEPVVSTPETSLASLAQIADLGETASLQVEFSGRVAKQVVCTKCQKQQSGLWWVEELDQPALACGCGGDAYALPFFTHRRIAFDKLAEVWDMPLAEWGVGPGSVLRLSNETASRSYGILLP